MVKCSMCGRMYDVADAENYIGSKFGYDELERIERSIGRQVCDSCMLGIHYADQGEDSEEENISVYDAALIWQSSGYDEDKMFGFTEEELLRALI